jgi:AcrR family transcriptional regulator
MAPEERREQLLDTALDIALERGFHAVTIDGVAREAGVTRPVVYGQFADATALLAALLERGERRALGQLAAVLPSVPARGGDPDALLLQGLEAYLTAVAADPPTWRVVLLPPEGAPAELARAVEASHHDVLVRLQELATWGLRRRGGPGLDPELFARSLLVLAEDAARLVLKDPQAYPVTRFTDYARRLLAAL